MSKLFESLPLIVFILSVAVPILLFALFREHKEKRRLINEYSNIIDVDKAIRDRENQHSKRIKGLEKEENKLEISIQKLEQEFVSKGKKLSEEYQEKLNIYNNLLREIALYEEDLEMASFAHYKPHFDFDSSEEFKVALSNIRDEQKLLLNEKKAATCDTEWVVGGNKREGSKLTNRNIKLILRAFNNECDASILKVTWNNVTKMEERIKKAFDTINALGEPSRIKIENPYLNLKLKELRLTYEYKEKLEEEKEEQRRIREIMREEEKVQKEIENAKIEAEKESRRLSKAMAEAKKELAQAHGAELEALQKQMAELEQQLKEAVEKGVRATSMAELTKSGHVYVISNIGAFGDEVYKIGMTRRLEPSDRVLELSGASVPFPYDIHAMIYTENAPELEYHLHKQLDAHRLNLVNKRKEFFRVSLERIKEEVDKKHGHFSITRLAEAREYRETLSIRNPPRIEQQASVFPASL